MDKTLKITIAVLLIVMGGCIFWSILNKSTDMEENGHIVTSMVLEESGKKTFEMFLKVGLVLAVGALGVVATKKIKIKFLAVLSYLTFLGWLVAYLGYRKDKQDLIAVHLRQALLIHILAICVTVFDYCNNIVSYATNSAYPSTRNNILGDTFLILYLLFILTMDCIGIFFAACGRDRQLPLIGKLASRMFKFI